MLEVTQQQPRASLVGLLYVEDHLRFVLEPPSARADRTQPMKSHPVNDADSASTFLPSALQRIITPEPLQLVLDVIVASGKSEVSKAQLTPCLGCLQVGINEEEGSRPDTDDRKAKSLHAGFYQGLKIIQVMIGSFCPAIWRYVKTDRSAISATQSRLIILILVTVSIVPLF